MMLFKGLSPFALLIFCFIMQTSFASDDKIGSNFQAGLKAYDQSNFPEAESLFKASSIENPNDSSVLYNIFLSLYKQKKYYEARAYLKKAVLISPNDSTFQQSLNLLNKESPIAVSSHRLHFFEVFKNNLLDPIHLIFFHFIFAIALFATLRIWIKIFALKKTHKKNFSWADSFTVPYVIMHFIFIFTAVIYFSKLFVHSQTQGILITEKESVRSAPKDDSAEIFSLNAGLEFVINKNEKDWLQITYAGSNSGWIKRSSVFVLNGELHD